MSGPVRGEPDVASVASAFADPRRAQVLMALADGRSLPAGRLAEEAGVAASTISNHLAVLLDHRLVEARKQGRHRYYRLASPHVEGVLEALARLAPKKPVTSLRAHSRASALRTARTCYKHLAGQLGVRLFQQMIELGWITGGDGRHDPDSAADRLSAPGTGSHYRLTETGSAELSQWGVPQRRLSTRTPLRYCVDWTEQAHHLAGPLGTALATHLLDNGCIARGTIPRSIVITDQGADQLAQILGISPSSQRTSVGLPSSAAGRRA